MSSKNFFEALREEEEENEAGVIHDFMVDKPQTPINEFDNIFMGNSASQKEDDWEEPKKRKSKDERKFKNPLAEMNYKEFMNAYDTIDLTNLSIQERMEEMENKSEVEEIAQKVVEDTLNESGNVKREAFLIGKDKDGKEASFQSFVVEDPTQLRRRPKFIPVPSDKSDPEAIERALKHNKMVQESLNNANIVKNFNKKPEDVKESAPFVSKDPDSIFDRARKKYETNLRSQYTRWDTLEDDDIVGGDTDEKTEIFKPNKKLREVYEENEKMPIIYIVGHWLQIIGLEEMDKTLCEQLIRDISRKYPFFTQGAHEFMNDSTSKRLDSQINSIIDEIEERVNNLKVNPEARKLLAENDRKYNLVWETIMSFNNENKEPDKRGLFLQWFIITYHSEALVVTLCRSLARRKAVLTISNATKDKKENERILDSSMPPTEHEVWEELCHDRNRVYWMADNIEKEFKENVIENVLKKYEIVRPMEEVKLEERKRKAREMINSKEFKKERKNLAHEMINLYQKKIILTEEEKEELLNELEKRDKEKGSTNLKLDMDSDHVGQMSKIDK